MATNGKAVRVLTPAQRRAIAALLLARDVAEAAKSAKVGERTLHRWLADDAAFVAALEDAQRQALDATLRRLTSLAVAATSVIAKVLADEGVSAATRLRAADMVLARLLQWREVMQLEERLAALEAALSAGGKR